MFPINSVCVRSSADPILGCIDRNVNIAARLSVLLPTVQDAKEETAEV